jgi:ribonuclease J
VIFSSRVIPGNEKSIARIQNGLARRGIEIITEKDHFVHVSGHPARDELAEMYGWVKPPVLVPIHGETRHLIEHERFARQQKIPHTLVAENGAMVRLHPGPAEIVDHVTTGRFAVDGKRLLPVTGDVMRARRRIGASGIAVATIVLDDDGRLIAEPRLLLPGLLDGLAEDGEDEIIERAVSAMGDAVDRLSNAARGRDEDVEAAARRALRRILREEFGRRPLAEIQIVRV